MTKEKLQEQINTNASAYRVADIEQELQKLNNIINLLLEHLKLEIKEEDYIEYKYFGRTIKPERVKDFIAHPCVDKVVKTKQILIPIKK
jgi:nucleoid DNA-binding protein